MLIKLLNRSYFSLLLLFVFSNFLFSQENELPFENNIQLRYNAENVSIENNKISSLTDQSIFNNDANQNNAVYRPKLIQDPILGNVIHFGNDLSAPARTYLNFSPTAVSNNQFSIFLVLKKSSLMNVVNYLLGNTQQGLFIGGSWAGIMGNKPGLYNNPTLLKTNSTIDTTWVILTVNAESIFINGEMYSDNGAIIPAVSFNTIGTRPDATHFYYHGDFLEMVLYDTLLNYSDISLVIDYFKYNYSPTIDLGNDIYLNEYCDTTTITGPSRFTNYLWSTGSTDSTITVNQAGKYWCDVIDIFGFHSSDTILVHYPGNYLKSFSLCNGQDSIWDTQLNKQDYTFLWQDGSTDSVMVMNQPGEYYCSISSNQGCTYDTDTVLFSWNSYTTTTHLPQTPTICTNGSLSLESGAQETVAYAWYSDESPSIIISTEVSIIPTASQNYWVVAQNDIGCVAVDTTLVTLLSGTPTPIAGFESTLACSTQEVLFSDTSVQEESSLETWQWNTNDGQASSVQDPAFTFNDFGQILVSLKITNTEGCSAFAQKYINVHPVPVVNLGRYDNLCTNTNILFQDSSSIAQGSISEWNWLVDGESIAQQSPPNKALLSFEEAGNHELTQIVVSDSGCVSSLHTVLPFHGRPVSLFSSDTVCVGTPVTLSALSDTNGVGPVFYEWVDYNGNYLGGAQFLNIATGNTEYPDGNVQYPITLISHTSDAYCSDTLHHFFRLEALPNVQISRDQACVGDTVTLSASAEGIQYLTSYQWELEGGLQSDEADFQFVPNAEGYLSYSLFSSTQLQGCETLMEDSVKIYNLPTADYSGPSISCLNTELFFVASFDEDEADDGLTFEWKYNDVLYSNDTSITIYANQTGLNQLELLVLNGGECQNSILNEIGIYGAIVNIEYVQACEGLETELIANPDTSFSGPTTSIWKLENGEEYTTHSLSADLGAAGEHWVINSITDTEHNCTDTDSTLVKVSNWPIADFPITPQCVEEEFVLYSNSEEGNDPIGEGIWMVEGNEYIGEQLNYTFNSSGTYAIGLVVISAEAGCADTLIQDIEVEALPNADFSFSPATGKVPLEVNFENTSDSAFVYTWYFGANDISFDTDPEYTFVDTGWVQIKLVAETTIGCSSEKTDSIYVHPPKVDIEVMEVIAEVDGDYVTIRAKVRNNGYYTVDVFESYTTLGTSNPVKNEEFISISGEDFKLTDPSGSWYYNPAESVGEQAFACVEVSLADGSKDEVPENDKACVALSNDRFIVYDPFPNPGSDNLTIRMILPEEGSFSVELYSTTGDMVLGETYNGKEGFNELVLNTFPYSAGNYKLLIRFGEKKKVFSWVKS